MRSPFSRRGTEPGPLQHCVVLLVLAMASATIAQTTAPAAVPAGARCFDFGKGGVYAGWTGATDEPYTDDRGFGWVGSPALRFETQGRPDDLRHDFATGTARATFAVRVPKPGLYRLAVVAGDMRRAHRFTVLTNVPGVTLPPIHIRPSQYLNASAAFVVHDGPLQVTFEPEEKSSWVCNGLLVMPAAIAEPPSVTADFVDPTGPAPRDWRSNATWPDPTAPLWAAFEKAAPKAEGVLIDRAEYLKFIESDVDFWAKRQDANGAIIDPYLKTEWQYSTPCFAFAAAQLAQGLKRDDLVEPAARALDWATLRLSQHKAATGHEDFYPPHIAHAMELLKPRMPAERYAGWVSALRSYQPFGGYEMALGSMNWNCVALSGESMFHDLGVRDDLGYVEASLAAQNHLWADDWGVYLEGPIPYDAWPRLFLSDMLAHGYAGAYRGAIAETLRRGALTGLFMQSPTGEMPVGARSSQHVWNEALECALFEDAAARATDPRLAGAYRRGAWLALRAMQRWKRPTGELQIVHNHADPKDKFGYEIYTAHSQYNLMACTTLCSAYQRAAGNRPATVAPAEVGGYVMDLRGPFHKVIANAGGTYVEVDTAGDGHYSPTGLLRVHRTDVLPAIGPSDGLVAHPNPVYPKGAATTTAAVGVAWQGNDGKWHRLAECLGDAVHADLTVQEQSPGLVAFTVRYTGKLGGPTAVVERYVVTPGRVEQTSVVEGYAGHVQIIVPVLANDGREDTQVDAIADAVSVRMGNSFERFEVPGATVGMGAKAYAFRNGWARLAMFDVPSGRPATLVITPSTE